MNEQLAEQPAAEQPLTTVTGETVVDDAPEPLSISEHAKAYGPNAEKAEPEQKAEDLKPIRPVDRQKREQGKFAEGTQRLKASEAVKRINELTGRAKSAEEKLTAAEAELARLRSERASPTRIAAAEQRVDQAERKVEQAQPRPQHGRGFPVPEPKEDDPQFNGDFMAFWEAKSDWKVQKGIWEFQQQQHVAAASHRQNQVWDTRIAAARAKYADFDAVARETFPRIPEGSALAGWIEEHDLGEDVLYYLGKNTQELDALLRQPTVLKQFEAVTLLAQRFASTPSQSAGATGSATGRPTIVLPPRPPNPVRTEAQRPSDAPPKMDGSLSIAEHAKAFGPARRAR